MFAGCLGELAVRPFLYAVALWPAISHPTTRSGQRVASLFSRRGYNIDSLAVGPTENPKVSRMTIVLNLEGHALDQVSAQLFKLVNVIGISEMKDSDSLKREILLVKVANTSATKDIVKKHNAVIADESTTTLSIEAVGQSAAIESLLNELRPQGIRELVQSGLVALERGDKTLADRTLSTMGTANESDSNSSTADYQN